LTCDDSNSTGSTTTRVATFIVAAGETVKCTYTNTKQPKLIIKKITSGAAGGPFGFSTTASTGAPGDYGLDATLSLTTLGAGDAGSASATYTLSVNAIGKTFTITESSVPNGWALTDVACNPAGATPGDPGGTKSVATPTITAGAVVTCTFTNSGVLQTTRTQGFWATHKWLVTLVWQNDGVTVGGIQTNGMTDAERTLCVGGPVLTIDQVMGGFWAGVSQKAVLKPTKRSDLDQARMQLLQQMLAAILNNQLFGSSPSGGVTIDQAKAAFCGTNVTAIKNAASKMAAFNESGDSGVFTPGASADAKTAKATANIAFWDVLPNGTP
jgi:hypothetical protein